MQGQQSKSILETMCGNRKIYKATLFSFSRGDAHGKRKAIDLSEL